MHLNDLDRVRTEYGVRGLKYFFNSLLKHDNYKSIQLVNSGNICFFSLYVLLPALKKSGLNNKLNMQNQIAFAITDAILNKERYTLNRICSAHSEKIPSILTWMLETGSEGDGFNDRYDDLMDKLALILVKNCSNINVLPVIVHLIFYRNRKGHYYYDLAWALFESKYPSCLFMIAERLISGHIKDTELTRKLLNFIPGIEKNRGTGKWNEWNNIIKWLSENYPFLNYTGESFQQKNCPSAYMVSLKDKYLCRNLNKGTKTTNRYENKLLMEFDQLDNKTKMLLSEYSYKLYRLNYNLWQTWLHFSLNDQIKTVKAVTGGLS